MIQRAKIIRKEEDIGEDHRGNTDICYDPVYRVFKSPGTITEKSAVAFSLGGDNLKRYFDQR